MIRMIAAVAALGAAAAPVAAAELKSLGQGEQVRAVAVSKAGVDFSDAAQVRGLYGRLKAAADQACRTDSADLHTARADQDCVARALAAAVRSTDKPLLTAAYQGDAGAANRAFAGNDQ